MHKVTAYKDENGGKKFNFDSTDLRARPCKKDDFGIAVDYFHNLPFIDSLFCIDKWEEAEVKLK